MYHLVKRYRFEEDAILKDIIDKFVPIILKEAAKYKIKRYDYEDLVQHGYLSTIKAVNMYKGNRDSFH